MIKNLKVGKWYRITVNRKWLFNSRMGEEEVCWKLEAINLGKKRLEFYNNFVDLEFDEIIDMQEIKNPDKEAIRLIKEGAKG